MYVVHFFYLFRETRIGDISVAIRIPISRYWFLNVILQRQDIALVDSRADGEKILEHLVVPESQIYMYDIAGDNLKEIPLAKVTITIATK